jgi:CRISPR/Cas system CMR-associated protein Cmr5 small subunit
MAEEFWCVAFEDNGVRYLVAVFESEQEAIDHAQRRDTYAFSDAMNKHADKPDVHPEPKREDYEGRHDVFEIDRQTAQDARAQLERGLVVRLP